MATLSRFEVEHLHRLMMQASAEASEHDRRLQDEQKHDGLSTLLRHWHEAAGTLHVAVQRARTDLQKDGTPREQIERISERLVELQRRAKSFDLEKDLEDCVGHWKSLSLELGQLSGKHRDTLIGVLGSRQPHIDEATSALSSARRTGGMAPDNYRRVRDLQTHRDRSSEKYGRLRERYLDAEREHQKEHGKAAIAHAHGTPGHAGHALPPWAHGGRHGPIVVQLPAHGGGHGAGRPGPGGTHGRPANVVPHTGAHAPRIGMPAPHHGGETHSPPHHGGGTHGGGTHALPHHATSLRGAQRAGFLPASTGAVRAQGPLRISLEKIERPIGFPTGNDGIGRGNQTAHLYFRAENLDGGLSISGTTAIQLGAACRLDVAPSLHLFSAAPGAPVRGRLSLGLVSSGGRLGMLSPRNALDGARGAARSAASRVADNIGPIGLQLKSAIADVLGEAADKIFSRAQPNAIPHRLPQRQPGQPGQPRQGPHHRGSLPVEHHVARFDHALGGLLHEARSVKGAGEQRHSLHRVLDREHARRDGVATRLEQTLGHLATAAHRTLTDSHAGELRNNLARMDSILSRLRGKRGDELIQGAHEIGQILSQMGSIASSKGGSLHVGNFRKLIDERRSQLAQVAGEARRGQSAHALPHRGPLPHMPSAQVLGERALDRLRKQHPGLDKLLRNASSTQLAHELAKVEKGALHALQGRGGHAHQGHLSHHRLGGTDLLGRGAALGGAHLGGLGGGHRGGALGQVHGQGGLAQLDSYYAHILHKEAQRQGATHRHHAVAKALGELKKSPAGSPLHQLAVSGKLGGPLRLLEKTLANPRARGAIHSLEKGGGKGGIWVAGKAGRDEELLNKTLDLGDKASGALKQIHDQAPGVAGFFGDNAVGHFIAKAGDYAGMADGKLGPALERGDGAADRLSSYNGHLKQGLQMVGVKNPDKAYARMQARGAAGHGHGGALAQQRLQDHRERHPELHLARATGKRMRTQPRGDGRHLGVGHFGGGGDAGNGSWAHPGNPAHHKRDSKPQSALERALARGQDLRKKGVAVAAGVHKDLGHIQHLVSKGLAQAGKVPHGLEQATNLARQGAGILGDDSELGRYLLHVPDRADGAHAFNYQGIGFAREFNTRLGTVNHAVGGLPGVHEAGREKRHRGGGQHKPGHRGTLHEGVEHGLLAIEKYKKHALKTGRKIDHGTTRIEQALRTGMHVGRKIDHGLQKVSGIADQVSKLFGGDSPIGHIASQLHGAADAGHDKLHGALKIGPMHHAVHHGPHGPEHHVVHHGPHGHHPAHHGRSLHLPHGLKLPKVLQDLVDKAKSLKDLPEWLLQHLGLGGGGHPSHVLPHHDGPTPDAPPAPHDGPRPQHGGGGAAGSHEEAADLVRRAGLEVTGFAKGVTNAIAAIQGFMREGRTKDAGHRVQAVSVGSEQTRFQCTRAVTCTAKYPALHKQARELSGHYLEIRSRFFKFVSTLHGLAGQADAGDFDPKKYPDVVALSSEVGSLEVKVNGLGEVKHADSAMQEALAPLRKEAVALQQQRFSKLKAKYQKDAPAEDALEQLASRLGRLQRVLTGHGEKGNVQQGDHDLGVEPAPHHRPEPRPHHRRQGHAKRDPVDQLLDGILDDDGRLFIDRGGNRGDVEQHDGQDIDPAAQDTWLGSGQGVELFSQVFGAFIPAHGASSGTVVHHHAHGEQGGHGGHVEPHYRSDDFPVYPQHGPRHRRKRRKGGILGRLGKLVPGKVQGFFNGLFDHLHGFADRISGWAHKGEGLLGKGMHFAEMGMHGLTSIEGAAEKVQGFAGKAEGFLNKLHLGKAAGFAHRIGGAAGWVDHEAQMLHGGLKTADKWMGSARKELGSVEKFSGKASRAFVRAEQGHFGGLLNLFKSSRSGDGIDGKLSPDKVRLGSQFDEPRRLDISTMGRMEGFLGASFGGVRIHTGPGAAEITGRFNAEAVTVKDHIFFAPGRFNPQTTEGQKLLAHELTHVLQRGRKNLDVRTAESEALHSERSYGSPNMETLNLGKPAADFKLADGEGMGASTGIHTAKRNRSRGHESGGMDDPPDGEQFLELVSSRVYELLMEELEASFESR